MDWKYKCLRCEHKFQHAMPPKPWHGRGFNRDLEPEEDETKCIPSNMPVHPECPRCGHLYVRRINR